MGVHFWGLTHECRGRVVGLWFIHTFHYVKFQKRGTPAPLCPRTCGFRARVPDCLPVLVRVCAGACAVVLWCWGCGAGRRCCWCWCCWCWPSVLLVLVCADHCTDGTAPAPPAPAPPAPAPTGCNPFGVRGHSRWPRSALPMAGGNRTTCGLWARRPTICLFGGSPESCNSFPTNNTEKPHEHHTLHQRP